MSTRWAQAFEIVIASAVDDALDGMADGRPPDYAQYLKLVGFIQGLKEALHLAQEVDKRIVKGE